MKAARVHEYGPPEALRVEDIDPPAVLPRDVLIEVVASSVNPIDCKLRSGAQRAIVRYSLPVVLGMDVSGVVKEVGKAVTRFRPGDEVWSSPTHRRQGTYAEYVAIDERQVAPKPRNVSHAEAASLPLVGLTAYQSLVEKARVSPGQQVVVTAGSGGVGTFAIQLAKHLGAKVAATCGSKNVELVRSLGADVVVDYTKQAIGEALQGYDVVLDALAGEHKERALGVLRRGGRLVSITMDMPYFTGRYGPYLGTLAALGSVLSFNLRALLLRGVKASNVTRRPDGAALGEITRLVEAGAIRPVVDRIVPLADIAEAHRYSETGRARGKVVIAVR